MTRNREPGGDDDGQDAAQPRGRHVEAVAAAMRRNLTKRKAQARARRAGAATAADARPSGDRTGTDRGRDENADH